MSSSKDFERLFKQQATINKLIVDGKRDPTEVSVILSSIISKRSKKSTKAVADDLDSIRTYWEERWRDLGVKFDPAKVAIPLAHGEFSRVLMMPKGIRQNQLRDICKGLFACNFYKENLDKAVPYHDRYPLTHSYAVGVRDRVEADEELKGFSAFQLMEKEISIITLPERIVYEIDFFKATGNHLDNNNVTLCSGSRDLDGYVPRVRFDCGRLYVYWHNPGAAHDLLRGRAVSV